MKKKYFCSLIIKLVGRKLYVILMNSIDRQFILFRYYFFFFLLYT